MVHFLELGLTLGKASPYLTPYEAKDFNRFWILTPDSNFPGYQVAMIFLPLCLSHLVSKYLFRVIA